MKIYMIGIGGIGMSALAQLYLSHGEEVSGSDREAGPTTELLEKKGIPVIIGQRAENVPKGVDRVIYSDAIPYKHSERVKARKRGIKEMSYFQALGEVSHGMTTVAVAGTHGKTTTTAMLTKILHDAGKNPTAIIGSIVRDFGNNFVLGSPDLLVVEACEYKDHVLELSPKILVITNIEWDHTDWFKTEEAMRATFQKAIDAVPKDGKVITAREYSKEPRYKLKLIGTFNQDNARAASAAAKALFPDITNKQIAKSLKAFQGTWRRFEYKGKSENGAEVYDDYAHHPTAIRETIGAVRQKFPSKKIVVAFHPHLYSRTEDLFDGFVSALAGADRILLAPIYAAREVDAGEVSSDTLAAAIVKKNKQVKSLLDFDAIYKELVTCSSQTIIITMGAGDIYKVADRLVGSL